MNQNNGNNSRLFSLIVNTLWMPFIVIAISVHVNYIKATKEDYIKRSQTFYSLYYKPKL
ncbi:unnamed protein product [Medioppia subpectinata]|uniref:Uncharacterized protein n=1 Tax=Medioppia subpectinata TaxID=1979941 RepID=A0A7R9LJN4_9ACAR|nr:unnamed protein product [Medioppia subpectinata]CAG2119417.1 unnamed protein product [Medioppia subpectinata]